ncbi:MAG: DUF120 domain-containing protein [DPANN group archaeon]|nr:DUF120 domain-containing protein [DPANN group archaeon]
MPHLDYLLLLARKGCLGRSCLLSTGTLAKDLSSSQQTVSRTLIQLEDAGFIERQPSYRGVKVRITRKGNDLLATIHRDLLSIFEQPTRITGRIRDGLGEGAWYIRKYAKQFKKLLGYAPFFGTLNLSVDEGQFQKFIASKRKRSIPEFRQGGRIYGAVDVYEATLRIRGEEEPCGILGIERTRHPAGVIEVIAEKHIRTAYDLKEDDTLELI